MKRSSTNYFLSFSFSVFFSLVLMTQHVLGQYQMEKLNRGVVAIRTGNNNFISWRWLGTEDDNITFNLYRGTTKVNATPLTITNYTDVGAALNSTYTVRAIINGVEQPASAAVTPWAQLYKKVPLQVPAGGTTPDGVAYTYSPGDCSVGDVDGDSQYEIFVKWDPSNAKDNSQGGYTGNVYIDCYTMSGTRLWRIDLGRNIRAGAHYTQFMVYDFDGDGKAEMACKTADATVDGKGVVIGNANADFRASNGYILSGPEFLTVFNGQTGAAMATANYTPARGTVSSWGDGYGNRVDRFIAVVAYLDGQRPSMVFGRGYYTRLVRSAWDWRGGKLTQRWIFDSNGAGNGSYFGMGNHQMSVGDMDGDGKQEILNGASAIDDNGRGLFNNGLGHGDALHMSDMDPDRPGLEIWQNQEEPGRYSNCGANIKDAKTGVPIYCIGGGNVGDVGRSMAADVDPRYKGYEMWASAGNLYDCKGNTIGTAKPSQCFGVYWDGDLQRELLDGTKLDKWNYTGSSLARLATLYDAAHGGGAACNGTKATPNLSADLFGDWREEIILHSGDNTSLLIYTTPIATNYKFRTLMHDPQYRVAIAWQNSCYNQPPHLSYYLGSDMTTPAKPNITIIGGSATNVSPTTSITLPVNNATFTSPASITINANATDTDGKVAKVDFYNGTTLLGSDNTEPYTFTWTNVAVGTYTLTTIATDDDGAVGTSAAIKVTVTSPNTPPVVSITSPLNNTNINGTPATVTITANASDAGGAIAKVEFFNGTTLLFSDVTAPYSYSWTGVMSGSYVITAVATDNLGATTTSTAVNISVLDLPTDCNGVQGGKAVLDNCDRCTGGTTGLVACKAVMEAEAACAFDGILESTNEGFNGDGYVNTNNVVGSSITFVLNAANTGNAIISFRYAATTDRAAQLSINGVSLPGTIAFTNTGTWIDWTVIDVTVPLVAGSNTLKLTATQAAGLANIDQIGLVSTGLTAGNCGVVTGVEEGEVVKQIVLFPNPSASEFNLQLPEKSDVKVTTMQGSIIETAKEVRGLQFGEEYVAGVYFVEVTTNGTTQVWRVVKK